MPLSCIPAPLLPGWAFPPAAQLRHCAFSASPGWGEQCHLPHNIPSLVFHPAKLGRIPSHPIPSAGPAQPPTSPSCSQPEERPWLVLHSRAALAWAPWAQLGLRLLCLAAGGASWGRTVAAGSPHCPGTRGMLRGAHSFPHLLPELSRTTHLSKPLLSANNKSQSRSGTGSPERAGCWHPRAHRPGGCPAPAPSLASWAAAGLGVRRGDG